MANTSRTSHETDDDGLVTARDTSPWMICPTCEGEGRHSRDLGSFTMSEFNECFDDPDDRAAYFDGAYDTCCATCGGSGKIRESQIGGHLAQLERERIHETGRNSAGEWVCTPDWWRR